MLGLVSKKAQAIGTPPPPEAERTGRARRRGKNPGPARAPTHDERALQMGVEVIR